MFEQHIYPKEITMNKANFTGHLFQFSDLDISFSQGKFNTHIFNKRDIILFLSRARTSSKLGRSDFSFRELTGRCWRPQREVGRLLGEINGV